MQAFLPDNVFTRAVTLTVDFSSYNTKDWILIAVSALILVGYEGFFVAVYHIAPHHCTLYRNIRARQYVNWAVLPESS